MIPRRYAAQPGDEQSPKERRYRNLLQQRFMADAGTPEMLADLDRRIAMLKAELEAPAPGRAVRKASGDKSETMILREVISALKRHPKVAKVWRQNSATFTKQYGNKTHYIRANTAQGMSDIMGLLKNGRTLACEVKSRTGRIMPHQQEFLDSITAAGGIAFVARDPADVLTALATA